MPRLLMDPGLARLCRIAHTHRVGVRLTNEQQFLRHYQRGAKYKGYIEVQLGFNSFANRAVTLTYLRHTVAKSLAHELGHFLIAPLGRRYRKDYGIPVGHRSERAEFNWDLDEAKAVLVENHLLIACGYRRRGMKIQKDPLSFMRRRGLRFRKIRVEAHRWWRACGRAMIDEMIRV